MKRNLRILVMLSLTCLMSAAISAGQQPNPYRISLREAVQRALEHNVNVLTAWTQVDESRRHVTKVVQECNWLQGLEGGIDTSHAPILHRLLTDNSKRGGIAILPIAVFVLIIFGLSRLPQFH